MNIADLRARHWGDRCWVICNGPSLNKVDLAALSGDVTIGMNGIFKADGFRPDYHVIEDREFAQDYAPDINRYRGPVKVYASDLERIAGLKAQCPVRFHRGHFDSQPKFSTDMGSVTYWGSTVTYMALQLAYYLGCHDVLIVGADHHMVVPDTVVRTERTYTSQGADPNHFHPDYFGPGKRWHAPRWDLQEAAYTSALHAYTKAGRRIRNATVGGKLEVFPRVDWQKALH